MRDRRYNQEVIGHPLGVRVLGPLTVRSLGALAVLVSLLTAAPRAADAEPSSAQAETLFRRGRQLAARGKLAEACGAFEASQALEPMVTTLINLAACREKNHQLATAWGLYLEVVRQLRAHPDPANQRLAKVASERAARLEPRLSHLTIEATAIAGLEITRSGDKVEPGAWNQALPIDGGTYDLTARAPGRVAWSAQITIAAEGETRAVVIPALAPALARVPAPLLGSSPWGEAKPAPARAGNAATPAPVASAPLARPAAPPRPSRAPAIAMLGLGSAAVIGSLVLGASAQGQWHDAQALCGGDAQCDDATQAMQAHALAGAADTRAAWATGLAATGAVALGVGAWLLFRAPPHERVVQLAPHAGPGSVGLVARGSF